jgi:hypothetical protein
MKCHSAVGINKASTEWNDLIMRLKEVGDCGFAGDYSNWDGSVLYLVLRAAYDIINRWYNDEYSLERDVIAQEVGQARHGCQRWVYTVDHSLPSGIDLTVVINNLVNEIGLRVCWMSIVRSPYDSLYYYRKFVRTALYGDDNMVSVGHAFLPQYNQLSVTEFFKRYNITYTNTDKTESSEPFQHIEDLSFLKCTSRKMAGYYVPIMEPDANLETLNWITKSKDQTVDELCEANCNSVLRNCFFSGKPYFEMIRNKIIEAKPSYNLLTFYHLYQDFTQTGQLTDEFNEFGFTRSTTARIPIPKIDQ